MDDLRMHESGSTYVYELELPPVEPDSIVAEVLDDCVTVSGGVDPDPECFGKSAQPSSAFCRRITLPADADLDHVRAILADGVLRLRAPRLPRRRQKLILERRTR